MASHDPLIILNPAAGGAQAGVDATALRRALVAADLPDDWIETTPEHGVAAIIGENSGDGPVVVMGGDGTVNEAARVLRGGSRPLAIIPRGTGNVMALRLSIPLQTEAALKVVRSGIERRVDVGIANGEPFLLAAGMGVDGRLMREAHSRLKKQMGQLAYLWSAFRNLPVQHSEFLIHLDARVVRERGATVVVANFGTQVGPWIFPPDAQGGDGELDGAEVRAASISELMSFLVAPFRLKPREHKGVRLFRARRVSVECSRPLPLQLDGEDRGDVDRLSATIEPRSLPVIVSSKAPPFQWSREWPPATPLDWKPWGEEDD